MKKSIRTILFAVGISLCLAGQCAWAEEALTEALTEAMPLEEGAATPASAEEYYLESGKTYAATMIQELASLSEEEVKQVIEEGGSDAIKVIAATWDGYREELGAVKEITNQEAQLSEDGKTVTVVSEVEYEGVPAKTSVSVTNTINVKDGSGTMDWDIKYPMSKLIAEAGLNTLLGIGIVFVVLLFLSFIIGQIHWIPDLIEKAAKKDQPAVSAPVKAPAPAPVIEEVEEDLTDDEELVAVIAAAIAASEQTSTDGFVVRSIRKAARR